MTKKTAMGLAKMALTGFVIGGLTGSLIGHLVIPASTMIFMIGCLAITWILILIED